MTHDIFSFGPTRAGPSHPDSEVPQITVRRIMQVPDVK